MRERPVQCHLVSLVSSSAPFVQFLRENIVALPEEDYKEWLQARVPIPKRARSAPPL